MSKLMVITRGLPGTGKTTAGIRFFNKLRSDCPDKEGSFFSEDDFWYQNGNGHYRYQHKKLSKAREFNLARVQAAASRGDDFIFVDNIHLKISEMLPYARISLSEGYELALLYSPLPPKEQLPLLAARNSHGVRLWILELMWSQWEEADVDELLRKCHADQ